ncbi:MAG: GIY-YIG nuclease family protein [Planctomycetota bacterium]|nr:GIY-YIG nuclease family protein [Planctomycetota bacterium]
MTERRWQAIIPVLGEFQSRLAPDVPALRLEHANDSAWSMERYREQCKTGIFNQWGVYLIFNKADELQYVGLAMYSFHKRIWSHDENIKDRGMTDVIAFSPEHYFFSPALEFFLICRLRPPMNKTYRTYTIPPRSVKDDRPV